MNETYTINLGGRSFFIDVDAYQKLNEYLTKIKNWFKGKESGDEIIADIESRLVELFSQTIDPETGVVNMKMVEDAIETMGQPEDFEESEATDPGHSSSEKSKTYSQNTSYSYSKKLYRDMDDRVLGGVCSGLAAYFNMDPTIVRVIYAIFTFLSAGTGIPVYLILWILLPPAITTSQKLEMEGESINIFNIERKIKEEYEDVKTRFKNSDAYKKSEEFFKRKNQKDRNLLIIILIVIGVFFVFPFLSHLLTGVMHGFTAAFHIPISHHSFSLIPLILILLAIGLIFKTLLKVMLYIIAFLVLIFIVFNIIGFIHGGLLIFT